jgi:hypothetical protein
LTFINCLIHSMNRRCAAVINANGGQLRYWMQRHLVRNNQTALDFLKFKLVNK